LRWTRFGWLSQSTSADGNRSSPIRRNGTGFRHGWPMRVLRGHACGNGVISSASSCWHASAKRERGEVVADVVSGRQRTVTDGFPGACATPCFSVVRRDPGTQHGVMRWRSEVSRRRADSGIHCRRNLPSIKPHLRYLRQPFRRRAAPVSHPRRRPLRALLRKTRRTRESDQSPRPRITQPTRLAGTVVGQRDGAGALRIRRASEEVDHCC